MQTQYVGFHTADGLLLCLAQPTRFTLGGASIWDEGQGCWTRPQPIFGAAVTCQYTNEGWVIGPFVHGFLDNIGDCMWLPINYWKIIQFGMMTWGVCMIIDMSGCPGIPLKFLPTVLPDSPMHSSLDSNPLETVYYSSFLGVLSLSLGATTKLSIVLPPLN